MVATSYPLDESDWRGVFIRNLAAAIARMPGVSLELWAPPGDLPPDVIAQTSAEDSRWLAELMRAGGISHVMRAQPVRGVLLGVSLLRRLGNVYKSATASLYHVNWLQCALALPSDGKPVLISALGNDMTLLKMPGMRAMLRQKLKNRRAAICPNSEWMARPLSDAFGDLAEVTPVSFGIGTDWFEMERSPDWSAPEWLVVTRLTRDKVGPLFAWSESLFRNQKRKLHLLGPMQESITIPDWVAYHGATTAAQLRQTWFPRACGLITLSEHSEGTPQVLLEAMAAGIPIVASAIPGHMSIVEAGSGAICQTESTYRAAIASLENRDENLRKGSRARAIASERIGTWDDCAKRYAAIYERLLRA